MLEISRGQGREAAAPGSRPPNFIRPGGAADASALAFRQKPTANRDHRIQ